MGFASRLIIHFYPLLPTYWLEYTPNLIAVNRFCLNLSRILFDLDASAAGKIRTEKLSTIVDKSVGNTPTILWIATGETPHKVAASPKIREMRIPVLGGIARDPSDAERD